MFCTRYSAVLQCFCFVSVWYLAHTHADIYWAMHVHTRTYVNQLVFMSAGIHTSHTFTQVLQNYLKILAFLERIVILGCEITGTSRHQHHKSCMDFDWIQGSCFVPLSKVIRLLTFLSAIFFFQPIHLSILQNLLPILQMMDTLDKDTSHRGWEFWFLLDICFVKSFFLVSSAFFLGFHLD